MEVFARAKNVRISPRKVRLVVDVIRGMPVDRALRQLEVMPQKAAKDVYKCVRSAVANAENNFNMDPNDLLITRCAADEGRTLKRWRPRARGRVNQILKRSSHITIIVAEKGA